MHTHILLSDYTLDDVININKLYLKSKMLFSLIPLAHSRLESI